MLPFHPQDILQHIYCSRSSTHFDGKTVYNNRTKDLNLTETEKELLTSELIFLIRQKMCAQTCSFDKLTDDDFKRILDDLHSNIGNTHKKLNQAGFKTVSYCSVYSISRAKEKIGALIEFLKIDDARIQAGKLSLKTDDVGTVGTHKPIEQTGKMDDSGKLKPIERTGHNSKITALAMVSHLLNPDTAIPLHKHKNKEVSTSIRSLAKQNGGSVQGEILSVDALIAVAKEANLGKVAAIKPASLEVYRGKVIESIKQNKPLIAFFLVNNPGLNPGLPSISKIGVNDADRESRERACVITAYEPGTDQITITHSGNHYQTTISDLYKSSQLLSNTRTSEAYFHYTHPDAIESKWFRLKDISKIPVSASIKSDQTTRVHQKSTSDDGFQGTLITFLD